MIRARTSGRVGTRAKVEARAGARTRATWARTGGMVGTRGEVKARAGARTI